MRILQRLNLLMKGQFSALLDRIEDPERSLHQIVLDMHEELDAAKRAVEVPIECVGVYTIGGAPP